MNKLVYHCKCLLSRSFKTVYYVIINNELDRQFDSLFKALDFIKDFGKNNYINSLSIVKGKFFKV